MLLEFPKGCVKFNGPHNAVCKKQAFLDAGCLEQGRRYAITQSDTELDALNLM